MISTRACECCTTLPGGWTIHAVCLHSWSLWGLSCQPRCVAARARESDRATEGQSERVAATQHPSSSLNMAWTRLPYQMNTQHLPESIAAFLAPVKRRGAASGGGASKRAQKRRAAAPRIGVYLRLGSSTFADPVTMARIIEVHNEPPHALLPAPIPSLCLTSTPRCAAGPKWLRHARAVGRATLAAGPTASRGA